jgi:phage-related protein
MIIMNSFIWKGRDSYIDFGIIITQLPPETVPEENIEEIPIPGRDGDLTIDYKTKKPYPLPVTCTLIDFSKINEIKAWLSGSGDLVLNWQPDFKYKATSFTRIDIAQSVETLGEFLLVWKVQPHKYEVSNNVLTFATSPVSLYNAGENCKPIIKIFGTGDIDLTINSNVIHLTGIVDYITIDSDIGDCYKDTDPIWNNHMSGEFPEFIGYSYNTISWVGTVTKIEVTPNWRYL